MYCQLIKQTSKYRGQPVPEGSAVRFVNIIFFPSGFIFDVSWIKFYSQLSFGLSSSGAHSKKSSFASFHLFSVKQLAHDRSGKQMCNLMLMGRLYLNHCLIFPSKFAFLFANNSKHSLPSDHAGIPQRLDFSQCWWIRIWYNWLESCQFVCLPTVLATIGFMYKHLLTEIENFMVTESTSP